MKIKRFFAPDIRSAMKMVKEELGADAVIMSNRSVEGGVEIVAARDFDEQMIHKKLKKDEPEEGQMPKKSVGLTNFDEAVKPSHVISSTRKRGVNGTLPENPIRRNMDQYLGYAEKIQLANTAKQRQTASDRQQASGVAPAIKPASQQFTNKPANVQQTVVSIEQLMHEMRNEMRNEINGLKAMMDSKLVPLNRSNEQPQQANVIRSELQQRLGEMGVCKKLSDKIANRLGGLQDAETAFAKAQAMLEQMVPIAGDELLESGGIAALVGPTGVGKTTTIAKIAAQFILRHGSRDVALITTDNYRIGAHEQLNIYGRILDVPVRIANDAEELSAHIGDFSDRRLILIDTAGMSQRDMRLVEQINTLRQHDFPIQTYLVMSAATQYRAMNEIIESFRHYQPQAGILTKLDEAVAYGEALSAIIEQQLPLSFLTDGQQVPEDFRQADAEALIGRCVAGIEVEKGYTNELSNEDWVAAGYA